MIIHQPNITGSLLVNGEESGGVGAGFPFSGSAVITGSLFVSGSTISGSFVGNGSGLTDIVLEDTTVSQSFSSTTTVTVSHNFSSNNILVNVYDENNSMFFPQSVTLTDTNTVDVTFSTPKSGFAVVAKGGHIVSGSSDNALNLDGQPSSYYTDYNNLTNVPTDFSGSFTGSFQADSLVIPKGTSSERPTNPIEGSLRYNTSTNKLEFYNGNIWVSFSNESIVDVGTAQVTVTANDAVAEIPLEVEYLVIAGGGGGAGSNGAGGGGGAGGYRSSVQGESSGGGASAESTFEPTLSTNYTVTVGAGGAGGELGGGVQGADGSNSVFNTITSTGGGGGGGGQTSSGSGGVTDGRNGGSGGGGGAYGSNTASGGTGTANQGFDGGDTPTSGGTTFAGSGGGASEVGSDGGNTIGTGGGDGVTSSITGSAVIRGGGGGGGRIGSAPAQTGGSGGGGTGGVQTGTDTVTSGTANTGGGGGGGGYARVGASGGSGVVILRYPSSLSITIGAGLTASTATVGNNKVTTFTAGTDTISFS